MYRSYTIIGDYVTSTAGRAMLATQWGCGLSVA